MMDFSLAAVLAASSYFGRELIQRVREVAARDFSNLAPFLGALSIAVAITLSVAEVPDTWAGFVVCWAVMAGLHEGLGVVTAWRKGNGD